jgi:hypothetical protein
MTSDDKLRRFAKQSIETARGFERLMEQPAQRELRRWLQAFREAELETASSETEPPPLSPGKPLDPIGPKGSEGEDDVFREMIRTINKEYEARGEDCPNGKVVSQIARRRLRGCGINVGRDHGDDIAGENEFKAKRRPPGQHS